MNGEERSSHHSAGDSLSEGRVESEAVGDWIASKLCDRDIIPLTQDLHSRAGSWRINFHNLTEIKIEQGRRKDLTGTTGPVNSLSFHHTIIQDHLIGVIFRIHIWKSKTQDRELKTL
jgi:hypothetical protein